MRRSSLLLVVLALCAAGFFFMFVFSGGAPESATRVQIQINEVMTSNKGVISDGFSNSPDWLELYNASAEEADISGFGLSNSESAAAKWAFPSGTVIPAGGYLTVFCSKDASSPAQASFSISSTDRLTLTNAGGAAIDSVQLYAVSAHASIARSMGGAWGESTLPSPGYPNTEEGAFAYRAALIEAAADPGVRLNEFMASNVSVLSGPDGDYPDWLELINTADKDADISGYGLSDDALRPLKWIFPKNTVVPAGGTLLVYCTGRDGWIDGALHASFSLNAYAEEIVFAAPNGGVLDSMAYSEQSADIAMARAQGGAFMLATLPTPGYPNNEAGVLAYAQADIKALGELYISEMLTSNAGSLLVEDDEPDWLEIHNAGSTSVNLGGYSLSDNPKNPAKWVFPDVTIDAGGYLLVLATGNTGADTPYLEASFRLSENDGALFFYSPDGVLIDKLRPGGTAPDVSIGRTDGMLRYYATPTPGEKNDAGYLGVAAEPGFSVTPGIYDGTLELALTAGEGTDIYYTTDCTPPGTNATRYTGPIQMSKNTVVRAVAVREGYLNSHIRTGTYLFRQDEVDHQLPVVSLVMDPDDLWNDKTGIYAHGPDYDPDDALPFSTANFYKKGDEWERRAAFAVFNEDGFEEFNQNIFARIAGSYGRRHPQKGFNLIARASEGSSRMEYGFFENRPFTSYKSLVLRAGGQDQSLSKIRDELSTGLLEGTDINVLVQAYKPYVLYLNGEYWGTYFLKEKRNRFFVAQHEGMDNNTDLNLIKSVKQVYHGSSAGWAELMSYVAAHDLSNADAYSYVADRVDMESFIDYMCTEIYVANSDYWNVQYYQTNGGKWKWVYYDFCWGWNNVEHKTVGLRRLSDKPCSDLFNALIKNAQWKDQFVRRMAELMDTVYAPERVNALVDELYATVQPEIERERAKFNQSTFRGMATEAQSRSSYSTFEKHIQLIRDFANNRARYVKENLQSELGLSSSYMQEVFG